MVPSDHDEKRFDEVKTLSRCFVASERVTGILPSLGS